MDSRVDIFDRTKIIALGQQIGSGKNSEVRRATAKFGENEAREVVIKFIPKSKPKPSDQSVTCPTILQNELSTFDKIAKDKPENIVIAYGWYEQPYWWQDDTLAKRMHSLPTVAMVMEFCPQGDLDEKLEQLKKENKDFPLLHMVQIMEGAAKGLKYLHDNDIVHSDLKPANIFLTESSEGCISKLADFGYAHNPQEERLPFFPEMIGGSALYFSYTQLYFFCEKNKNEAGQNLSYQDLYNKERDCWALLLIFMEMMNRKIPYHNEQFSSLKGLYNLLHANNKEIFAIDRQCPEKVDELKKVWEELAAYITGSLKIILSLRLNPISDPCSIETIKNKITFFNEQVSIFSHRPKQALLEQAPPTQESTLSFGKP